MQRSYHSIKAHHRSLLDRIFSTFAPDFTPDESNEIIRGIVQRAKEIGLSERHAVLGDWGRLTYVQCCSPDNQSGMRLRYVPPDHKIWDDPTYGLDPAEIRISIYSRSAESEEFEYCCDFVHQAV